MNKHSILLRIIIFFILALVATTALFKVMHKHEFTNEKEKLRVHYHHVAMSVMRWKIGESSYDELLASLKKDKISVVDNTKLYKSIQSLKKFDTVSCAKGDFHLYEQGSFRYVIVPPEVGTMLLKDENTQSINVDYVWWLYTAFIAIMLILFLSIAISLYPLKHLQQQIRRFGEGDIDIDFTSTRKDEIADVSIIDPEYDGFVFQHKERPDGWTISHGVPYQDDLVNVYLLDSDPDAFGAYTYLSDSSQLMIKKQESNYCR